jgi:bifunctional non-homologous end joining protein LigD
MASADPLQAYRLKRDFERTPEPGPEPASTTTRRKAPQRAAQPLRFVIQKHHARRLHYDFRLELDGVLLSWAVPKGPSLDPRDKRMAVRTEDHPLAYADFEGDIPPGAYGAGHVIVWDEGKWLPLGDARAGLKAGKMAFELHGHKLHGAWELVRMKGREGEKSEPWLLFKKRDEHARTRDEVDITAQQPDSVKGARKPAATKPLAANRDAKSARKAAADDPPALALKKAPLPRTLSPQLATLATTSDAVLNTLDDASWLFETKFDGYRMLARIERGRARLFTRQGHDWSDKLPLLVQALGELDVASGWLDGEIVVHAGGGGHGDFNALQNAFDRRASAAAPIVYWLFDVPYLQGHDLRAAPLQSRRDLLGKLLGERDERSLLRFSAALPGPAAAALARQCAAHGEGLIAKRRDAPYSSTRNAAWLKLKCQQRQEFVIGGFTRRQGSTAEVGSLLLGVHDDKTGALRHAGRVGTGWDTATSRALYQRLNALARADSPFGHEAKPSRWRANDKAVVWVEPTQIAEVGFAQWTPAGQVRHASFVALRDDKPARQVRRELPLADAPAKTTAPARSAKSTTAPRTAKAVGPRITHGERVIDARSGATKLDLVRHCELVADLLLRELSGRATALLRAPEGVGGEMFFQRHAAKTALPGVRSLDPALWPGHDALIEVATPEALLGAAQMNTIEFHPWHSRIRTFDKPDRLVFDLDPGEGVPFERVREGALLTRALLQELKLQSWLKTSGGKGLHVVVPIAPRWDFDVVKAFAKAVVQHLAATLPERFVAKSGGANRVGRIFVDYLRNGRGATTVAAYSARARPGLGVSMPWPWDDIDALRGSDHVTLANTARHLADRRGDPWADLGEHKQSIAAPMKTIGVAGAPKKSSKS